MSYSLNMHVGWIKISPSLGQPNLLQVFSILLQKRGAIGDDLEIVPNKSPATAGT